MSCNKSKRLKESEKIPVAVYVFPKVSPNPVQNSAKLNPEPDPRMSIPNCTREGTYHDLSQDVESLSPVEIPDNIDFPLGIADISSSTNIIMWRDDTYYGQPNAQYRVCNSDLPAGNGTSRTYYGDAAVNVRISVSNPLDNTPLLSKNFTCTVQDVMITTVYKSRECAPNWTDAQQIYAADAINCLKSKNTLVCPSSTASIGPTDVDYPAAKYTTYTYEWSPSGGLSDTRVRNPIITYSTVPGNAGQFMKYTCKVTRKVEAVPPTVASPVTSTETYCNYVYKCPDCGTGSKGAVNESADEAEENSKSNLLIEEQGFAQSFKLYPNPAAGMLNVEYKLSEEIPGILSITDLLGRVIKTVTLPANASHVQIPLDELNGGTYICIVRSANGVQTSRILVVSK